MRTQDVEKMIIGSIKEIIQDREHFYYSPVGAHYCHLTEVGERAIIDAVNLLGGNMIIAIEQQDIERSKQLVLDQLKGK